MKLCWIVVLILSSLLIGTCWGYRNSVETPCQIRVRIKEFGDKSTQLLTFLSFGIAAVALLGYGTDGYPATHPIALNIVKSGTMRWWVSAIFPVLVGILPVKEFSRTLRWLCIVRYSKFALLWVALGCIVVGAVKFYIAIA